ncbi:MAG: twitching motility protein PilT [Clostridiales bacterium]|nr:twitching motility protein PilT [Clostridiales bacterium]
MVQIIAGRKGKGKTKHLLDMANAAIKGATGTVVYLDKSSQHMYELNNKIRLINVNEFPILSSEGFLGFICGIISQDHDLETMYLDSFLKLACLEGEDISDTYMTLKNICEKYHVTFVLSISKDRAELPECAQGDVIISL